MTTVLVAVGLLLFGLAAGAINRREGRFPLVRKYGKQYPVYGGEEKGVQFITFPNVMMLDWDVPNEGHKTEECLTISRKEEALEILRQYCMEDKSSKFLVYETPGGVRGFLLSRTMDGIEKDLMERLKCDPLYTQFCVQRREWACRVSPKIGREGDYVAKRWCEIGEGPEDPSVMELIKFHDESVARWASSR